MRVDVPQPLSRQPSKVVKWWTGWDIGPHTDTLRWSYTVPTGKKAQLVWLASMCQRSVAPTTTNLVEVEIDDGSSVLTWATFRGGTVDSKAEMTGGTDLWFREGEMLEGLTGDRSTGGLVNYLVGAAFNEFDWP